MAKRKDDTVKKKEVKEVSDSKKINDEVAIDLSEIKSELNDYVKIKTQEEVSKAVEKATKKLIRHKNSIILKRNITIIILLIVCFFLGYNLYRLSSININIETEKKGEEIQEKVDKVSSLDDKNDFNNLKEKYERLFENIYINEDSNYLKDFYSGKLTDEIRLYLALNKISDEKISLEDDGVFIEEDALKESYEKLFDSEFSPKSFSYNDLKFHYLSSKNLFIADGKFEKAKSEISREIIDINEGDLLKITTVEGIIKDSKLFNVVTDNEIKDYKDETIEKYKKDLTCVVYYFSKVDDDYKLSKIEIV